MKLKKKDLVKLYRNLVRARKFDQASIRMLGEGKFTSFFHSAYGGEAPGVGGATCLRKDDYIYVHHRGHGLPHAAGKGAELVPLMAEHCGKVTGSCKGITGFHACDPENGIFGAGGTIGSAFPVSVGWGLAAKKAGKGQVVLCCFGDSSAGRGTMHEAMNMAMNWKLPIIWFCENNGMGQFVPIKDAFPMEDIASMAGAYGMPGVVVDGQDVVAVAEAVMVAVERARKGKGPSMVECKCLRFRSHVEGAPDWMHGEIRSPEEVEKMKKRDPVVLFQKKLLKQDILTKKEMEKIDKEIDAEVEAMEKHCEESPYPEPSILENALYAD